ncbi:uncharacterized protein YukE [Bacillus pakistanensis]|uniref:Uncharacterized protein YukE n=1 Tax=Rossellomorea pakistanensis TaxID=992288 RepID=A0ABS2NJC5_9BACI|nr:DnaJ family domain-containing protein [Bacillus pakistanensis]MBM7587970.1 uncharacterized protein YukE [Bacillus pakistanensis]
MDLFTILAEQRIKKANENGDFKDLPGYGKPLKLDDDSSIPEELRMAHRIMKNAGFLSEDNKMKQEITRIEDLLKNCKDELEKEELSKKLNENMLKYNSLLSKKRIKTNSAIFKNYETKIEKKLL